MNKSFYFLSSCKNLHYAYLDFIKDPPYGIKFINSSKPREFQICNKNQKSTIISKVKDFLSKIPIPTFVFFNNRKIDIIYSSQTIPLTLNNWILDLEIPYSLTRFHKKSFENKLNILILKLFLNLPNCIGVTTWSKRAADALKYYNIVNTDKIHVVQPAFNVKTIKRLKKNKTKKLLFVGTDFERKGGEEILLAFSKIKKTFTDAELYIASIIPEKYKDLSNQEGVFNLGYISREELFNKYYLECDIFLLPTYQDTYGFAIIEALCYGMYVITTDDYATKEITNNIKNVKILKNSPKLWFNENGTYKENYKDIYKLIIEYKKNKEVHNNFINEISESVIKVFSNTQKREILSKKYFINKRDKMFGNIIKKNIKLFDN
jgi:glycosyltransferase involved in cell wall biosynthesis